MNTSMFETCRRQYNWIKSLMKKVCIVLFPITYVYHNAQFKKRKDTNRPFSPFMQKRLKSHISDYKVVTSYMGARCWWRSWLRHCAITRKVAGSIPHDVTGIFHWHNPSGHTMALGSTQPLTEMNNRNISWRGKGGRCVGLTTLPPSCADCLEILEPQPPGSFRACPGL